METQIIDDKFGLLTYVEDFDSKSFWFGKSIFYNHNIDVLIPILDKYPTAQQKNWFELFLSNYESWVPVIFKILPKQLRVKYGFIDFSHFNKHFIPKSIIIPKLDKDDTVWGITFQSLDNPKHFLSVNLKGSIPIKAILEK